jgi:protein transport protein SEC61 subunit gamma-like protein
MQPSDIQQKLSEYYKVLKMARKPDWEEFSTTAKVAVAVMFIVGLIGFFVYIVMEILPGAFK